MLSYSIADKYMGIKMAVTRRENNASINAEAPLLGKTISLNMSSSMVYSNVSGGSELSSFQAINVITI